MELRITAIVIAGCLVFCSVLTFTFAETTKKENSFEKIESFCHDVKEKSSRPFVRLYFFTSDYCTPCKIAESTVLKCQTKYNNLVIVRQETVFGERFKKKYAIVATPTFIAVRVDPVTGKEKVFDRWVGGKDATKKIEFAFKRGVKDD